MVKPKADLDPPLPVEFRPVLNHPFDVARAAVLDATKLVSRLEAELLDAKRVMNTARGNLREMVQGLT